MTADLIQHRTALEVRARWDARTIELVAIPYDTAIRLGSITEDFAPGAFSDSLAKRGDRVKLTIGHGPAGVPVGKAFRWDDLDHQLVGHFKVSRTRDGDEALEMAADGVLDASIEFEPVDDRWSQDRRHVRRLAARMHRVALVPEPAYEDAQVLAVRSVATDRLDRALRLLEAMRAPHTPAR